jgi:hypothetical protein
MFWVGLEEDHPSNVVSKIYMEVIKTSKKIICIVLFDVNYSPLETVITIN